MKVNGVSFNTFLHFPICTEKELITPPLNGLILPGVTRKSLLELAKSWVGYSLHEISYYFLSGPYVVCEKLFSISIRHEAICVKTMLSSLSLISKTSQTYRYSPYR